MGRQISGNLMWFGIASHATAALALGACVLIYYGTLYRPRDVEKTVDRARMAHLERLLLRSGAIRHQHEELSRMLSELHQSAQDIRNRIPDEPSETLFLRDVARFAQKVGLDLVDYQRGRTVETATHSEIEIELKCRGDFNSICRFLNRVSGLPRLSSIRKLTIEDRDGIANYPVQITLVLYFGVKHTDADVRSDSA